MLELQGKLVQEGIAIGKIKVLSNKEPEIKREKIVDATAEIQRINDAIDKAKDQLQNLYEDALKKASEDTAAIFEVHQMMLEDEDYIDSINNIVESEMVNGEYAVARSGEIFSDMFASMDDEYMQARAADVKDISNRVVSILMGKNTNNDMSFKDKVILLAKDLTPSETVQLDKDKILAFVTVEGSLTSHTAILARTMNIPALIQVAIDDIDVLDGKNAVVDAKAGRLIVEPDSEILKEKEKLLKEEEEQAEVLQKYKGLETVTKDGRKVHLYGNVGSIGDIAFAQQNDAEGIGLFRSEFLYLGRDNYPSEEEQFQVYKQALQLMGKKKVVIRTCDIGADKQVDYFNLDKAENPAFGYTAIRICLDRVHFLKTQLRALFRASVYGNLSIMYPMITSISEVHKIKEIVNDVKHELEEVGVPFRDNIEQGIMIETPAAALISDELAKEVDFFSVGTNDLTQYTLAVDRQNAKLETTTDIHHPAILKLIEMAAKNAHDNGIWIGICGELGADMELTQKFMDMEIDELSVSPGKILKLRKKISQC